MHSSSRDIVILSTCFEGRRPGPAMNENNQGEDVKDGASRFDQSSCWEAYTGARSPKDRIFDILKGLQVTRGCSRAPTSPCGSGVNAESLRDAMKCIGMDVESCRSVRSAYQPRGLIQQPTDMLQLNIFQSDRGLWLIRCFVSSNIVGCLNRLKACSELKNRSF